MFSQLFFLMLVSFLAGIAIDASWATGIENKASAAHLIQGIGLYCAVVAVLCAVNRYLVRGFHASISRTLFFDNIVIVSALTFILLYLQSFAFVAGSTFFFAKTSIALGSIFLYLSALYLCNYSFHSRYQDNKMAHKKGLSAVRFLLPFSLPFLLATLSLDIFGEEFLGNGTSSIIAFLAIVLMMMIFLPPIIVWTWGCPPMQNEHLKARLDAICERTHFTHAGYRMWTVAEDTITAAIVGLVGRWRYILFTKKLLERMPETSIEAILAHEIGHNKRKHLWIYPWILFGMLVTASAASDISFNMLQRYGFLPNDLWMYAQLAAFVAAMALYFRYVFGFFSRLFERQADLYVYEAGIDPNALIEAFQQLARALGTGENDPSWHHYSIRERIDFLRRTQENPSLVQRHHRTVYLCLTIFTVILLATIFTTGTL